MPVSGQPLESRKSATRPELDRRKIVLIRAIRASAGRLGALAGALAFARAPTC
jgi:hypothetical protein